MVPPKMTPALPIAWYAMLADGHSAALVSGPGSVDWWCPARFDGPSVFARLLDAGAGHFSLRPVLQAEWSRAYRPATLVLETTFTTRTGQVRVTDALALAPGARGHDIGREAPHTLLRRAVVLAGEVELELELVPRPAYGAARVLFGPAESGAEGAGGGAALRLTSDVALHVEPERVTARWTLSAGQSAGFALAHADGLHPPPAAPDPEATLEDTARGWRSWSDEHDDYDGAYRELVHRSALVLRALVYGPSGAIVAAPTTSLPEVPGGEANWDYRYAWLRDASFTLNAMWVAACPLEAERYFDWMARAAGGSPREHVQIMFGVDGEVDLSERELDHLAGYGGARPVRVGNAAWSQRQLDVPGEVLDAAWLLRDRLGTLEPRTARFLAGLADRAARSWRDTDAGIWEKRGPERHHVASKVMCWVALDRAVRLAEVLDAEDRAEAWALERDAVRAAVLEHGWSERAGAYGDAFGSDELDASVLLMALVGFAPGDDERLRATVDVVERELGSHDGLVRRWPGEEEGAFLICSFWLAEALARTGRVQHARDVFERAARCANDVGLLAEEVHVESGALLGNFPQAFSHIGLINAAWAIDQAQHPEREERAPSRQI